MFLSPSHTVVLQMIWFGGMVSERGKARVSDTILSEAVFHLEGEEEGERETILQIPVTMASLPSLQE